MTSDRGLAVASTAFGVATAFGSAVSARHDVRGRPFGISVPLSVRSGLLLGWGAGVAAPWPMPAAALVAAGFARRGRFTDTAGIACLGLGLGCVVGTLVEPVTYRPASPLPVRVAILVNLGASLLLAVAGLRVLRQGVSVV